MSGRNSIGCNSRLVGTRTSSLAAYILRLFRKIGVILNGWMASKYQSFASQKLSKAEQRTFRVAFPVRMALRSASGSVQSLSKFPSPFPDRAISSTKKYIIAETRQHGPQRRSNKLMRFGCETEQILYTTLILSYSDSSLSFRPSSATFPHQNMRGFLQIPGVVLLHRRVETRPLAV